MLRTNFIYKFYKKLINHDGKFNKKMYNPFGCSLNELKYQVWQKKV